MGRRRRRGDADLCYVPVVGVLSSVRVGRAGGRLCVRAFVNWRFMG